MVFGGKKVFLGNEILVLLGGSYVGMFWSDKNKGEYGRYLYLLVEMRNV